MRQIWVTALFAVCFCSCNSFLKEYSQDLARVKTVGDLEELLIGSVYYPAVYITSSDGYTSPVSDENGNYDYSSFNHCVHFMTDELEQNQQTGRGDFGRFEELFGYYTWQRNVGINQKGTKIGKEDDDWQQAYKYINVANMILTELEEIDIYSANEEKSKVRLEGETRFLRALYYFSLVNLYAAPYVPGKAETTPGIPLKLTSYIENKAYERTPVAQIYEQIIDDLERAAECLRESEKTGIYRANTNAVNLLLSRVYLYMQDYVNARKYAQLVIDAKPDLKDLKGLEGRDNVLSSDNPEVIFSMGGDWLTYYIYGTDQTRYQNRYPFYVSDNLIAAYSNDDLRKQIYIQKGENDKYYYKKIYWGRDHWGSVCSVSDNYLFRTSEAYLNLAEAAVFGNDEPKAREVLGQLLAKRFTTPPVVSKSGEALIRLIQAERQRELCLEGHRWYDIRRYTVLPEGKGKWTKTITHVWAQYSMDGYDLERVRVFELPPDDNAFTLALPKEVLEFQVSLGYNHREERVPVSEEKVDQEY